MKRFLSLIIATLVCALIWAQDATVRSFEANPIDLAAQRYKRTDVQGNICALIKIQTIADNVSASGSVIGEVKKNRPGEYWLYMPGGAKMVKIFSDDFLPLMYNFPEPLQGGVTYTMVLNAPQKTGIAQPQPARQAYLLVKVEPSNAMLTLNGEAYSPKNGLIKVLLRNGKYTYHIEAPGHFPYDGEATIDGTTVTQEVKLRSSKPTLNVHATMPGTQIYINGELRGTGDITCEAQTGLNEIEGRLEGYRSSTQTVELASGDNREVAIPALQPIYGSLNIDFEPVGATISIDDREVGVTPMVVNDLLVGSHKVTISAPDYNNTTLSTSVTESQMVTLSGSLTKNINDSKNYEKFFAQNGKCGLKFGDKIIAKPEYDYIWPFSSGLAVVCLKEKYGYINTKGQKVIPLEYQQASSFSEGLAAVSKNKKFGFIDTNNKVKIPFIYDGAKPFSNGRAWVKIKNQSFYIDKSGNRIN